MKRRQEALIATEYVRFLGNQEGKFDKRPRHTRDEVYLASAGLGRICRGARGKSIKDDVVEPKALLAEIARSEKATAEKQQRARMLRLGIQLAEKHHLHRPINKVRSELQTETALQMRSMLGGLACRELKSKHSDYLGYLNELTTIALVNHPQNPEYLALPAPPHHDINDRDKTHLNYDVLFMGMRDQHVFAQPIQVKGRCQGFCDKPNKYGKNDLGKYAYNVALISGHCDLDIDANVSKGKYKLEIPNLLVASVLDAENLPMAGMSRLDKLSEQLIHTIVDEGWNTRAGRATRSTLQ